VVWRESGNNKLIFNLLLPLSLQDSIPEASAKGTMLPELLITSFSLPK